MQLLLRSKTRYYSRGSIIADSKEKAKGLIVITSGQVLFLAVELDIVRFTILLDKSLDCCALVLMVSIKQ